MQHRISAGAIVEHQGRVLLVRHVRPGKYDFWVAPGGGVKGDEELTTAAAREVREEAGLDVQIGELLYVEELIQPDLRHCKFWFRGLLVGGTLCASAPEAIAEFITEAAWLSRDEMHARTVFPPVLASQYWEDRRRSPVGPQHLGLRRMEFW